MNWFIVSVHAYTTLYLFSLSLKLFRFVYVCLKMRRGILFKGCSLFPVSMALKFHSERTSVTRTTSRLWYDRFINFHRRIVLTDPELKDLSNGLDLGRLMYLPKELQFNYQHMTDLVVSDRCIRPFKYLRWVMCTMCETVRVSLCFEGNLWEPIDDSQRKMDTPNSCYV